MCLVTKQKTLSPDLTKCLTLLLLSFSGTYHLQMAYDNPTTHTIVSHVPTIYGVVFPFFFSISSSSSSSSSSFHARCNLIRTCCCLRSVGFSCFCVYHLMISTYYKKQRYMLFINEYEPILAALYKQR